MTRLGLPRISRRRFAGWTLLGGPPALVVHAFGVEPGWLKIRRCRVTEGPVRHRFAHFTDVHFKGDGDLLMEVVEQVNRLAPDFACFTGDLIEDADFLAPAPEILRGLRVPLYALPGNHDHWSGADLEPLAELCAATGGGWLQDAQHFVRDGAINLIGMDRLPARFEVFPHCFNLLLVHYPGWTNRLDGRRVDLALAGHTHGGQVRIPFVGALVTPFDTDSYDLGWFDTPAGRLYVNPGIGTLGALEARFNCRPEVTLFEI